MSDEPDHEYDSPMDRPPVVVEGERIILQLRNPVYMPAGSDEWQFRPDLNQPSVKVVKSADECYPIEGEDGFESYGAGPEGPPHPDDWHAVTVCRDCIDSWYRDYNITLEAESFPPVDGTS